MKDRYFEFPEIIKSIEDFIEDEDGNITRSKLVAIGAMIMVMGSMLHIKGFADHRSHSSHKSHSSHSSTSYIRDHSNHSSHSSHTSSHGSHSSHSSSVDTHNSHSNHASHASHSSHNNTASHSNSLYSSEGDVDYGPSVSSIPIIRSIPQTNPEIPNTTTAAASLDMSLPEIPSAPDVSNTPKMSSMDIPNLETPIKPSGNKDD